ncbi:hypothetical protein M758_10G090800, partial [Ceratodon purpureus]
MIQFPSARAVAGPGAAPADDEGGSEGVGDAVPASTLRAHGHAVAISAIGVVGDFVRVDVDVAVTIAQRRRSCVHAFDSVVDHVLCRRGVVPSRRRCCWLLLLRVHRWIHGGSPWHFHGRTAGCRTALQSDSPIAHSRACPNLRTPRFEAPKPQLLICSD